MPSMRLFSSWSNLYELIKMWEYLGIPHKGKLIIVIQRVNVFFYTHGKKKKKNMLECKLKFQVSIWDQPVNYISRSVTDFGI